MITGTEQRRISDPIEERVVQVLEIKETVEEVSAVSVLGSDTLYSH